MNNSDHQNITVLLPAASIAVFSKDKDTLDVVSTLASDWRFARVKFQLIDGDVDTATESYHNNASPDLIVVQTNSTDESFTGKLETLAGHLSEGTAAIVIGPENDVYLYRRLIEMGVSDYLVKPVKANILGDVIGKSLLEKTGAGGSQLIALVGAKGGVGASAIAQALAWGAADILGEKTLLLDAAGGWSTLGVGMGFEPSTTLVEAARAAANSDEDSLKRMMFKASDKLSVLASGSDVLLDGNIQSAQFEQILSMVMVKYPLVIVDLSAAAPQMKDIVITRANQVILVSTPSLPSLRLARSLMQEIKDLRGGHAEGIDLILNMQGIAPGVEVSKSDIEKAMELSPAAVLPFNAKLFAKSESEGKKIIDDKEGRALVESVLLRILKKTLHGMPAEQVVAKSSGMLGGLLKKGKK